MALSNKGGLITLLNPDGLKVDGVSYAKEQASRPQLGPARPAQGVGTTLDRMRQLMSDIPSRLDL